MRVRVLFRGPAVRGPARVPDTVCAIDWVGADDFFQVTKLAFSAPDGKLAAVLDHRDTSRVIAPIFEPAKAVKNDGYSLPITDVADDAAHTLIVDGRPIALPFRWRAY